MKFSYHNHSTFSDGRDTMAGMVSKAFELGFKSYAITDHIYAPDGQDWTMDPKNYGAYLAEARRLKEEYEGRMSIAIGMEVDWYLGRGTGESGFEGIQDELDFVVGAVHFLAPKGICYCIDGHIAEYMECLNSGFGGNARAMVGFYFEAYREMLTELGPDLCAHANLLDKNNAIVEIYDGQADWYLELADGLAKAMVREGRVGEVNGGGNYRYGNGVVYPSKAIGEAFLREGVPMTIGLDAHSLDMLENYYDDSIAYLSGLGFTEISRREGGIWTSGPISDLGC